VANARGCGPEGIGQGIMAGIEIRPNHARGECRSLVDRQQTEARLAAEAGEKPYPLSECRIIDCPAWVG
jgi:hypothetical protein